MGITDGGGEGREGGGVEVSEVGGLVVCADIIWW